jgi:acetyltransferase
MTIRHLERLLEPESVAVIGASNRPASVGATVWRNLRAGGFAGPVLAVNPRHRQLDGQTVYARVADLPVVPDLAVVCTPPATVPGLIAELGAHGTRSAIVMTAGLDAALKQSLLDAARPHLLRVLGPNCLGLLTPGLGLNASFAHTDALPGDIAFVSQSGALVTAVLDWAKSRRIGFSHMISLGEHADVDFGDLLDWLASDPHTKSILLYIESIEEAGPSPDEYVGRSPEGTPAGLGAARRSAGARKFMSAARAAARNKPVIVVKAGRAGSGMKAAASHTGALAGSDLVYDAAIRRAGMLRVDTLADLFMAAQTLAHFGSNRSEALTIMTNGGGAGVMAADAAGLAGVPLAPLAPELVATLDPLLPANWSRANPIDIIGDAPVERYTATMRALLERDDAALLFLHAPTAIVRSEDIAKACLPLLREHPGRVMASWLGDGAVTQARQSFADAGVADYATPEEAVRAFAMLATYRRNQALLMEVPRETPSALPDRATARQLVAHRVADGGGWLTEPDAKALLQAYGVPVVPSIAAPDADTAAAAARDIGYPVALKILSPDITHKSDVGGVALGLDGDAAVQAAIGAMLQNVRARRPEARLTGFIVQKMAQRPKALELIVGASIDPIFGPVVLFGQGGTAVEVIGDRALALPPLNDTLAHELVQRTRVSRLLAGWRDHAPARMDAVCAVLVAVSQMLADLPELAELDINPLWADVDGVLALDARVRVDARAGGGAERFSIRPYPDQLEERITWRGSEVLLRPIRPEDGPRHRAFVERLSPEDLRLRFFQSRRELPKSEIARLTQIDYEREMAFIAVTTDPTGRTETLGVVRAVADPDNVEAEFAIIVRSDLKGQGLGHLLMHKLIRYCRARGTRRLVALVLRENDDMLRLARSVGLAVDKAGSDHDTLKMVMPLS